MEHTPTPWYCDGDGVYSNEDCEGAPLAHVMSMGYDKDFRNIDARRIVACINACAGLDTEQLEQFGLGTAFGTALFDVTSERDRLRTVCAEAYQFAGAYDAPVEVLDNLSAAANGWPLPHDSFLPVMDSEAVAQRDELLAVLEGLLDEVAGCMCTYEMPARAVIQKVRGGE